MEQNDFSVVVVDDKAFTEMSAHAWGRDAQSQCIQKVQELSQRYRDVPFFVKIDGNTQVAMQCIATCSMPTAEFIMDIFSVRKDHKAAPSSDIVLSEVIEVGGKAFLECAAGRALVQLLNLSIPSQLSLAALLELPLVAKYFHAESLLEGLFECCQLQLSTLSDAQVLHVLKCAMSRPYGHLNAVIKSHLAAIALKLIPDVEDCDKVRSVLDDFEDAEADTRQVVAILQGFDPSKWAEPLSCALFACGLIAAARAACRNGQCDASMPDSATCEAMSYAECLREVAMHSIRTLRMLAPDSLTVWAAQGMLSACDAGQDACACSQGIWSAITGRETPPVPHAKLLGLRDGPVHKQITLLSYRRRSVYAAKMAWPGNSDADGQIAKRPAHTHAKHVITYAHRSDLAIMGVTNCAASEASFSYRVLVADLEQNVSELYKLLDTWTRSGVYNEGLEAWCAFSKDVAKVPPGRTYVDKMKTLSDVLLKQTGTEIAAGDRHLCLVMLEEV